MNQKKFGEINPNTVSLIMKECVRRAILEIRRQRITFHAQSKIVNYKKEEDLVTSADIAAQKIFINIINENFPKAGIVAEEKFSRKCTDKNHNYYFTIDPLDGTRAYKRKQSHAVTTMIAFIFEGVIEAVTIGDPNTLEIFHSKPDSNKVYRIYEFEDVQELVVETKTPLKHTFLQLRNDPRDLSELAQKMTHYENKLFFDIEVTIGSIGFTFARLWKGEVGGLLIKSKYGVQTPWDACPVFGMSHKMGYSFFEIRNNKLYPYKFVPEEGMSPVPEELLCIHKSKINELKNWYKKLH